MSEKLKNNNTDPVAQFVLNGLIISVSHEKMKREEAIELFTRWFPEAEVIQKQEP